MQRIIARLLLILALAGSFAPAALAIAGPVPHACCLRACHFACKYHHSYRGVTIEAVDKQGCGSCCPPNVPAQWAEVIRPREADIAAASAALFADPVPLHRNLELYAVLPARAPPAC
jgi:hypothetical protein